MGELQGIPAITEINCHLLHSVKKAVWETREGDLFVIQRN